jgi:hypothetical protein
LNFPTKKHWKYPTKEEYLHAGLEKFVVTYQARQIKSIAFPLLGAQHGGLSEDRSLAIMMSYLKECDIPIEIYRYDPSAPDDAYLFFKAKFLSMEDNSIRNATGLRSDYIKRIRDAMGDTSICQLNRLASVKGIGDKTLEKAYAFVRDTRQGLNGNQAQLGL